MAWSASSFHRAAITDMVCNTAAMDLNSDTFKFAQKASAVQVVGAHGKYWVGISKDPVTDPGKASKKGRLTLVKSLVTGEHMTVEIGADGSPLNDEFEDQMLVVFDHGKVLNKTTLATVRARAAI